jgi:hypothetical protein
LASLTAAYVDLDYEVGPFAASQYHSEAAYSTFENAFEHPNASRKIDFDLYFNYTNQPWAWDISVADVAIPNREWTVLPANNYSQGQRLINTQWRLDFPSAGNQSINALLNSTGLKLRINLLRIESPAITGALFNASSGNCSEILGAECSRAFNDAIAAGTGNINAAKLANNCSTALANQLSVSYGNSLCELLSPFCL